MAINTNIRGLNVAKRLHSIVFQRHVDSNLFSHSWKKVFCPTEVYKEIERLFNAEQQTFVSTGGLS